MAVWKDLCARRWQHQRCVCVMYDEQEPRTTMDKGEEAHPYALVIEESRREQWHREQRQ
jgi:hypothetical protein